jgi:hypothetical protein
VRERRGYSTYIVIDHNAQHEASLTCHAGVIVIRASTFYKLGRSIAGL